MKMKRFGFWMALVLCCAACSAPRPQYEMAYKVGVDTLDRYLLVDLDVTVRNPARCPEITFNMPVWAPGYYEILDFPKHLSDFAVVDAAGEPLAWSKEGKNRWRVNVPGDGELKVSYRIYANRRDVASSRVETAVAFVAPAGVFLHVDGDLGHPVSLEFVLPDGWTQIQAGSCRSRREAGVSWRRTSTGSMTRRSCWGIITRDASSMRGIATTSP